MAKRKDLPPTSVEQWSPSNTSVFQKTKEQWLADGQAYSKSGQYLEALAAFKRAIRLDPSCAEAYVDKGTMLYNLNRYEEALTAYEQAILLDARCAAAYYGKGCLLLRFGLRREAFLAFEQAIAADPNIAIFHVNLGFMLWTFRRYQEAFAAYDRATQLEPNLMAAYMGKGNIALYSLNWREEALAAFDRVTQIDPTFLLAQRLKGLLLMRLKRYQEALEVYEQVVRLAPHDVDAHHGRARALTGLVRQGKKPYKEALNARREAIVAQVQSLAPREWLKLPG